MPEHPTDKLKILQVNANARAGGAAGIAFMLHRAYREAGHQSWMAVRNKDVDDVDIQPIPNVQRNLWNVRNDVKDSFIWKIFAGLGNPARSVHRFMGWENFDFPATALIPNMFTGKPDIIHLHNLHPDYFDLREISRFSSQFPVVITLHDAWLLSGHCAHSLDCMRWKTGCGKCPYLGVYPAVKRDATHHNWERKKKIYEKSRIYIAAPSRWIANLAEQSILNSAIKEMRVIHNGVDQSTFNRQGRKEAREKQSIPDDAFVLAFVSPPKESNPYKDFDTIWKAIREISVYRFDRPVYFLILGTPQSSSFQEERYSDQIYIRKIPYLSESTALANYFKAADIYLQASRADTFPTVVLEALSCGTPVIATSVGGIPEQIKDGETGFLVSKADAPGMAQAIIRLLGDDEQRKKMSIQASIDARERFDAQKMVDEYLRWYDEIKGNL
jgi:glycosyltransferase involved in cell wall biosynthesis